MNALEALHAAGWGYYVGRIPGFPGYTARVWRDLKKPVYIGRLPRYRECFSGSGPTMDEAGEACAAAVRAGRPEYEKRR